MSRVNQNISQVGQTTGKVQAMAAAPAGIATTEQFAVGEAPFSVPVVQAERAIGEAAVDTSVLQKVAQPNLGSVQQALQAASIAESEKVSHQAAAQAALQQAGVLMAQSAEKEREAQLAAERAREELRRSQAAMAGQVSTIKQEKELEAAKDKSLAEVEARAAAKAKAEEAAAAEAVRVAAAEAAEAEAALRIAQAKKEQAIATQRELTAKAALAKEEAAAATQRAANLTAKSEAHSREAALVEEQQRKTAGMLAGLESQIGGTAGAVGVGPATAVVPPPHIESTSLGTTKTGLTGGQLGVAGLAAGAATGAALTAAAMGGKGTGAGVASSTGTGTTGIAGTSTLMPGTVGTQAVGATGAPVAGGAVGGAGLSQQQQMENWYRMNTFYSMTQQPKEADFPYLLSFRIHRADLSAASAAGGLPPRVLVRLKCGPIESRSDRALDTSMGARWFLESDIPVRNPVNDLLQLDLLDGSSFREGMVYSFDWDRARILGQVFIRINTLVDGHESRGNRLRLDGIGGILFADMHLIKWPAGATGATGAGMGGGGVSGISGGTGAGMGAGGASYGDKYNWSSNKYGDKSYWQLNRRAGYQPAFLSSGTGGGATSGSYGSGGVGSGMGSDYGSGSIGSTGMGSGGMGTAGSNIGGRRV